MKNNLQLSFGLDEDDRGETDDFQMRMPQQARHQKRQEVEEQKSSVPHLERINANESEQLQQTSHFGGGAGSGNPGPGGRQNNAKRGKRPNLMLQLTDEEDRGKPEQQQAAAPKVIEQATFGHEESKIVPCQAQNMVKTPVSVSPSSSRQPYLIVEGPEPSQDLSYKWVAKYENVGEIEKGVPLPEFQESMEARDLDAEFRLLRKLTETKEHQSNLETIEKRKSSVLNRYAELKPFKHTRVRLIQRNEDIYDSYINANYINTSISRNDQLFIATQGPLDSTIENFWRMVDQERVSLIIMLTHLKEHTKLKCHQYWPEQVWENESNSGIPFDDDKEVLLVSVESLMPNLIKRRLQLTQKDADGSVVSSRIVIQLQYLTWPDFGAPEEQDYKIIKTIIEHLRAHHWGKRGREHLLDQEQLANIPVDNKIVLHCSAGIGRTGTLTAIYNLQQTVLILHDYIQRKKDPFAQVCKLSVFGVVRRLREQRYYMVQSQSQYEFIYTYINHWLQSIGLHLPNSFNNPLPQGELDPRSQQQPQPQQQQSPNSVEATVV